MNRHHRKFPGRPLHWDAEKVWAFWDFVSASEEQRQNYFSRILGEGLVKFAQHLVPLRGRVLDYGCGGGDLTAHLLAHGVACEGCDSSPHTIEAIQAQYQHHSLWQGATLVQGDRLDYDDDSFDVIFFVEVIEHLLGDSVAGVMSELQRILKPETGRLIVTTPHDENLEAGLVFCPNCDEYFHRVQHLRSFTVNSLSEFMTTWGFSELLCDKTEFSRFQRSFIPPVMDWTPRLLRILPGMLLASLRDRLSINRGCGHGGCVFEKQVGYGPHLFWVGGKNSV